MKNEFIPYDMALALKELGFDEPCSMMYNGTQLEEVVNVKTLKLHPLDYNNFDGLPDCISAPLYQQAFRWFREKGYHCGIIPRYDEFHYFIKDFVNDKEYDDVYNISSYEEAELACLRKLIEIIKNKEDENEN